MTDPTAGEPRPEEGDLPPSPSSPLPPFPPPPSPRKRWWHRWKLILALVLLTPVVLVALYTATALSWSYSEGQRAGYLQKFSKKGWLCKTWEGELALSTVPGVAPTMWNFTVRKESTARQINLALGRRVLMYYQEHRGVPTSCFGDTSYFVDSIRIVQ
jgi:hypothetical protein